MTSVAALPAFSHDWVGGDIYGLSALAGQCYKIGPQIDEAGSVLTTRADDLSCTAGWEGEGASAFDEGWAKVSGAGSELGGMWDAIGEITDTLAVELATLENALEEAAAQVEASGLEINQGTGELEPTATATSGAAAARIGKLIGAYDTFRAGVMARAKAYRAAAAAELGALAGGALPGSGGGISGVQQVIGRLNNVRQLWATPTQFLRAADARLPALEQAVQDAQAEAYQQLIAARALFGKGAQMPAEVRDQLRSATLELDELQARIDSAAGLEGIGSQIADGDPAAVAGVFDGAAPLIRAVPVVSMLAGSAATAVNDVLTGHSVGHGLLDAAATTGAGYGAGAGVAAAVGTATLTATAAGAVAAIAAGTAAGDFAHHLVDDLGQEVSKHGLLDGTVQGIGDAAGQTVHDVGSVISDII